MSHYKPNACRRDSSAKSQMDAKLFRNFTNEDFSWKYDGALFTFKAGQEMYMEAPRADHFAKHLVDRELNKLNILTNNLTERALILEKCLPSGEEVTQAEAINIEAKKKVRAKKASKKTKVEDEEEFADLNN